MTNQTLASLAFDRATTLARQKYPAPLYIGINYHVYELDNKTVFDLYCVHGKEPFIQDGKTMGEFLETYVPPQQ